MMTPLERYQQDLTNEGFIADIAQQQVVIALEQLYQQLITPKSRIPWRKPSTCTGLYIWGRVGRGKTYLMDCFYQCLPQGIGTRLHFHRFMQRIHHDLKRHSGHKNPLNQIALELSRETRVLCFDEFFVTDIGDAMILARLLKPLLEQGVTLVATSNVAPDHLYQDGLQRQRFLPAIAFIKAQTRIMALDGEQDYRLRELHPEQHYFTPLSMTSQRSLLDTFKRYTAGHQILHGNIRIQGRDIAVKMYSREAAWFDFMDLCAGPRSQLDYIEISQRFKLIVVSDIPILGGHCSTRKVAIGTEDSINNSISYIDRSVQQGQLDDAARRFIALVDELYDRRILLVVSAMLPIEELYQGGRVSFEFRRTISRLKEMQSLEYTQSTHSRSNKQPCKTAQ